MLNLLKIIIKKKPILNNDINKAYYIEIFL